MLLGYLLYLVLFIGGMAMIGLSFALPAGQPFVFVGGILAVSLAMAFAMRSSGSATHRRSTGG